MAEPGISMVEWRKDREMTRRLEAGDETSQKERRNGDEY